MNKAGHSGLETQRRLHQKSKIGVSVTPKKGLYPPERRYFLGEKCAVSNYVFPGRRNTLVVLKIRYEFI